MIRKLYYKTKKILAILILIPIISTFICCNTEVEIVQNGITIESVKFDDYSEQTSNYAEGVINTFISEIYKLFVSGNLPENMQNNIKKHAKSVKDITAKKYVTGADYLSFFEYLEDVQSSFVDAVNNIKEDKYSREDEKVVKGVFNQFTSIFGVESTGNILFDLSVYYFDYNYKESLRLYEKYKFEYYKKDAEEFDNKKQILENEIDATNFVHLTKTALFTAELLFGGALNSNFAQIFNANELCVMIKLQDFSSIKLSNSAWALLLEYLKIFFPSSYGERLFEEFENSGDLLKVANVMQGFIELIATIQNNLTATQTIHLIDKDKQSFIRSIFNEFDDQMWLGFYTVTNLNFIGDYNKIGIEFYANEFEEYLSSIGVVTFEQLKQNVSSENFTDLLTKYLQGICPAFFYGV